jgi:hypothetical protein
MVYTHDSTLGDYDMAGAVDRPATTSRPPYPRPRAALPPIDEEDAGGEAAGEAPADEGWAQLAAAPMQCSGAGCGR